MLDISQIPAPRVPITEEDGRITSRAWYRFFYNVWTLLYSGMTQGVFYATGTQTSPGVDTAVPMLFGQTALANGVYIGALISRIYVQRNNTCNIQVCVQVEPTSSDLAIFNIWLRVNGVDIPYTASTTHIKDPDALVLVTKNFVYNFAAGDYFEIMWSTRGFNNVQLTAGVATSPVPAIPSISLTVNSLIGV
jgi:hypothetical protein